MPTVAGDGLKYLLFTEIEFTEKEIQKSNLRSITGSDS